MGLTLDAVVPFFFFFNPNAVNYWEAIFHEFYDSHGHFC